MMLPRKIYTAFLWTQNLVRPTRELDVYLPSAELNYGERLTRLRELMVQRGIDIYLIPSEDAHLSEYIGPHDARRAYMTGFTGSAGVAVVTKDEAILSTDGRYHTQADRQVKPNWTVLKQGLANVPTYTEWIVKKCTSGTVIGVDPSLISTKDANALRSQINTVDKVELKPVEENLVDILWSKYQPARPKKPVIPLQHEFSGESVSEKLRILRHSLQVNNCTGIVISMLDEIAWLFNLRGSDIPYNPVFYAYAIITQSDATLYIDEGQISEEVKEHLKDIVKYKPYEAIFHDLKEIRQQYDKLILRKSKSKVLSQPIRYMITSMGSWAINLSLGPLLSYVTGSPVSTMKAVKNSIELSGLEKCHIRDGAAVIKYFAWLENQIVRENKSYTESEAADKLEEFRSRGEYYRGLSFATISATGANAAVIHYTPERETAAVIDSNSVYLCDSGAQYLDGTTDITRTIHFGEAKEEERQAYTLVLKGNIALNRLIFPSSTTGSQMDVMARQFLWRKGLDYMHGTGHGVGAYLNVHEGPIGVGTAQSNQTIRFQIGNVLSNEPGYYEKGKFGIRIENVMAVEAANTTYQFGGNPYFTFKVLTMVPMCKNLIDVSMLTSDEKVWLNDYHAVVYSKTLPYLKDDELALAWLKRETEVM